jgi:hypothetical protein
MHPKPPLRGDLPNGLFCSAVGWGGLHPAVEGALVAGGRGRKIGCDGACDCGSRTVTPEAGRLVCAAGAEPGLAQHQACRGSGRGLLIAARRDAARQHAKGESPGARPGGQAGIVIFAACHREDISPIECAGRLPGWVGSLAGGCRSGARGAVPGQALSTRFAACQPPTSGGVGGPCAPFGRRGISFACPMPDGRPGP